MNGDEDAFVAKVSADGTTIVYAGYIGGSSSDQGRGIAVDGTGNAYVTGLTASSEATFPVMIGPDLTYNGSDADAFVAKINASGTGLVYAGYIGGSSSDVGFGIAVDSAENSYVTGTTRSSEATFPVTAGPDLTYNGNDNAFVAKVNAAGTALVYAGYVGGPTTGNGIAVDSTGNAYVTGSAGPNLPVTVGPDLTYNGVGDAFVAKVNAPGTALVYAGYIGGNDGDGGFAIAVDGAGSAYVAGRTRSSGATFPDGDGFGSLAGPDLTHNGGGDDAFVAKVNAAGTGLVYAGYIGGNQNELIRGIAVDSAGNAYVAGTTESKEATFPVTGGPDLTFNSPTGISDAFVAKLNAAGTALLYAGYIGGSGGDGAHGIAVDSAGSAYVIGSTNSTEATFPVTVGPDLTYNGSGVFVAKVFDQPPADNVGPITSDVLAVPNPVAINISTTLSAKVNDATTGGSNIGSAEYKIDGGPFTAMAATDSAFDSVSEEVTAAVAGFTATGVRTLCVRGTDSVGNTGAVECALLPVYDPNGGFTTGGGSVQSPAGADLTNPSAAGPATFGFVSKYLPGRSTPDGNLEFQFQAASLNFKSTSMDWLVVTGEPRSIFRGTGTINGASVCKFEVDAWDGSFQPDNVDAFGLKIFSCGSGGDRYNLPARPLTRGNIIVQRQ